MQEIIILKINKKSNKFDFYLSLNFTELSVTGSY